MLFFNTILGYRTIRVIWAILTNVARELNIYKKIVTLSDVAKQSRLSHSNALNKAKRQTIGAFIEKSDWRIGV